MKESQTEFIFKFRRMKLLRVISMVIAAVFLHQQIVWAQGDSVWTSAVKVNKYQHRNQNYLPADIPQIPYDIGKNNGIHFNGGENVIFHIQDAHASFAAQNSIVELLDSLVTNYDITMIALEGADGYIDTSILKTFPDKDIRRDTADFLMREGRMSAGEFFSVTRDMENIDLYGVEDEELYRKNIEDFKAIAERRAKLVDLVNAFLVQLRALEEAIYSKDLRHFNVNALLHKEGKKSFADYWKETGGIRKRFKVNTDRYTELSRLLETIELEKTIDFLEANNERRRLIDELSRMMNKEKLEDLVLQSIAFKQNKISPTVFHKYLVSLAEDYNISSERYTNLITFARYVSLYETIDVPELYRQLKLLEEEIRDSLYRSHDERKLYEITVMIRMLKRLYNAELGNEDYEFIESRREKYNAVEFAAFIKDKCGKYGVIIEEGYDISEMFSGIEAALEFYRTAEKRNKAMLINTVKRMKAGGRCAAALITGGYHTKGLTKLMKDKELSYLVIAPKFKSGAERPYIAVLTGRKKPYQKLLESGKYHLAVELYFSSGDMARIKSALFYALGRGVLKGEEPDKVKDIWFHAYRERYNTFLAEKKSEMKFEPASPEKFKALLENIHVIRSGKSAVIADKTGTDSIVALAEEKGVYGFKLASAEQKREFLNYTSKGKKTEGLIVKPEYPEGEKTDIEDFLGVFLDNREKLLKSLDDAVEEIAKDLIAELKPEEKSDDKSLKEEIVRHLKRKGMPSDWKRDIGLKKRVNRVIALVRQDFIAEKAEKEKKKTGEWTKAIDVETYWDNLQVKLGLRELPEIITLDDFDSLAVPAELPVDEISFEFSDFINQVWDFIQFIIDSTKFKQATIAYYNKHNKSGGKNYQEIIQRLKSFRAEMLSNKVFSALGDDIPEEIRKHWNYVLSEYDDCRWFAGVTEKHTGIFEKILRKKITSQNKSEIEEYITRFKESQPLKNEKKVHWCVPANYIFIKILEATKYWENRVDVYLESKEQSCNSGVKSFINNVDIEYLEKTCGKPEEPDIRTALKEMLDILLLGNMYSDPTHETKEKKHEEYLVDDSEETLNYLFKLREQTKCGKDTELHVLHDNVGLELVSILYFIDFCIKNQIVKKVVLHTKNYPYCISDVTGEKDIRIQLDALSCASELKGIKAAKTKNIEYMKRLSDDIAGHLRDQNIVVAKPHWFPTVGQNFVDIPEDYYAELEKADLIMAIGDFWYRKLFLHRNWEYTADAKEILSYMPAPTVIIRIGKSPMIAGLKTKIAEYLKKITKWWDPPKFGMIHFAKGGKYAYKRIAYEEYEEHESTIDEQLEIAYAEGRFSDIDDAVIKEAAEFLIFIGQGEIAKKLERDIEGKRGITINQVEGIKNFRGHASWRGIHVAAELSPQEQTETVVHEIGAYYRLIHGLNLHLEELYKKYRIKEQEIIVTSEEMTRFEKLTEMQIVAEGPAPGRDYTKEERQDGNKKIHNFVIEKIKTFLKDQKDKVILGAGVLFVGLIAIFLYLFPFKAPERIDQIQETGKEITVPQERKAYPSLKYKEIPRLPFDKGHLIPPELQSITDQNFIYEEIAEPQTADPFIRTYFYKSPDSRFTKIGFIVNREGGILSIVGYDKQGKGYPLYTEWNINTYKIYTYTDDLKKDEAKIYDPNNNEISVVKFNDNGKIEWRRKTDEGRTFLYTYEYDPDGKLSRDTQWDETGAIALKIWEYNPEDGSLAKEINADSSYIEYEYSSNDEGDKSDYWKLEHHYDPNGRFTMTVQYDWHNAIVSITDPNGMPAQKIDMDDGMYCYYKIENGERSEFHYTEDNNLYMEIRYRRDEGKENVWYAYEKIDDKTVRETMRDDDGTVSVGIYNVEGNTRTATLCKEFDEKGLLTEKTDYEHQTSSKFKYYLDGKYVKEYRFNFSDELTGYIIHFYDENGEYLSSIEFDSDDNEIGGVDPNIVRPPLMTLPQNVPESSGYYPIRENTPIAQVMEREGCGNALIFRLEDFYNGKIAPHLKSAIDKLPSPAKVAAVTAGMFLLKPAIAAASQGSKTGGASGLIAIMRFLNNPLVLAGVFGLAYLAFRMKKAGLKNVKQFFKSIPERKKEIYSVFKAFTWIGLLLIIARGIDVLICAFWPYTVPVVPLEAKPSLIAAYTIEFTAFSYSKIFPMFIQVEFPALALAIGIGGICLAFFFYNRLSKMVKTGVIFAAAGILSKIIINLFEGKNLFFLYFAFFPSISFNLYHKFQAFGSIFTIADIFIWLAADMYLISRWRDVINKLFGKYSMLFRPMEPKEETEPEFKVMVGLSSDIYDGLKDKDMKRLYDTGIKHIVYVEESSDREKMLKDLSQEAMDQKTICVLLDKTALEKLNIRDKVSGKTDIRKLKNIIREFVYKAEEDILPLMHPGQTELNSRTVKRIRKISKLRSALDIYARTLPRVESLELAEKSIFDMRINNIHTGIFSKVRMTNYARQVITTLSETSAAGNMENSLPGYVSVSARTLADMRFIANEIENMGLDKQKASKFIQVRVQGSEALTESSLDKYMEATGLAAYLDTSNVKIVSEEMTLENTIEIVKETFGNDVDISRIAIGDTLELTEEDIKIISSEKAPLYVQMQGDGIASQLLRTVIEIIVNNGNVTESSGLGTVSTKNGYKNWYIYLPNMESIDLDILRQEIENYEKVLIML